MNCSPSKLSLVLKCCAPLVVLLAPQVATAQVVTRILDQAGDLMGNRFAHPSGLVVDSSGNVYVGSLTRDNVFKITSLGAKIEIIDELGDGAGNLLDRVEDVAIDGSGNVYVAGHDTDNVFKVTPAGVITQIIDSTGDGAGNLLSEPSRVEVDAQGNVYVTGFASDNVFKVTPAGVITELIDILGDGLDHFLRAPLGLALDSHQNVYVCARVTHNVFKITPSGVITQVMDASGDGQGNPLAAPNDLVMDKIDCLYVTSRGSNRVFRLTPGGVVTQMIGPAGDGLGETLEDPARISVDESRNIYVSERFGFGSSVFKIAPSGAVTETLDYLYTNYRSGVLEFSGAGAQQVVGDFMYACSQNNWEVHKVFIPNDEYLDHCNGDGGDQMGCTDCICGNNAPPGTVGGCTNSLAQSARLHASGSPSVSLPSGSALDLRLGLSGVPPGSTTVLVSGNGLAPGNPMNPCSGQNSGVRTISSDGLRCAVAGFRRHGNRAASLEGDIGITTNPWGGEAGNQQGLARFPYAAVIGETRYFQAIHRENSSLGCMRGLNSSQAVEVVFTP